jgi:VWFA-related protein
MFSYEMVDGLMNTNKGKLIVLLLIVFFFFLSGLFGQKETQSPKFKVRVDLVSLDVEVLDKDGNTIPGLTKSDFVVEENGKPMQISNFALSTGKPVSLVAVLDMGTISQRQLSICKEFLLNFAHKLEHTDEICLYSFDTGKAYLEQDLTTDRSLVMSALDNIGLPSKRKSGMVVDLFGELPPTALAIDLGLLKLREAHNGKRALLLISNRFKGLGPATVEHVQQSGYTLMTLAFPHKSTMIFSLGDEISSRQLMRESGGRRFSAESEDIGRLCRQVASSLKNYYSIGFLTEIKAGDNKPRKIRVRIPGRKCQVYFRRTYIPN